jgi:hypothetical protein
VGRGLGHGKLVSCSSHWRLQLTNSNLKPFASSLLPPSPAAPASSDNAILPKPPASLHNRIPFHRLPKNLVVHDPWGLLSADQQKLTKIVESGLKKGGLAWPEPSIQVDIAQQVQDETIESLTIGTLEEMGGKGQMSKGAKSMEVDEDEGMKYASEDATKSAMDVDEERLEEIDTKLEAIASKTSNSKEDNSHMDVDAPIPSTRTDKNEATHSPKRTDVVHHFTLSLSSAGRTKVAFEQSSLARTKEEIRQLVEAFRENPRTHTLKPLIDYFDIAGDDPPRCTSHPSANRNVNPPRRVEKISKSESGVYGTPGTTQRPPASRKDKGGTMEGYRYARWTRFGILIDPREFSYGIEDGRPWTFAMWKMPPWLKDADPRFDNDGHGVGEGEKSAGEGKEETSNVNDETAHLYLSPLAFLGSGNHSLVYNAEWDLPRSTIFDGTLEDWCEPLWRGWERPKGELPMLRDFY